MHNRHSRAGGNPGLGVPHEDRKNRPHLDPSPSERPLPHRHSRTRRPLHNRHSRAGGNPAFGGSPRGSKESPSPHSSSPTVIPERPLHNRHSRAGGNPGLGVPHEDRKNRPHLDSLPSRDRCTTVIPAQAGIQIWGRERRRWTCETPSKRGRPPRPAGRGGVPASRCSRPAKIRRPGTRPSGSCCPRRPGPPTSAPSRVPLRR